MGKINLFIDTNVIIDILADRLPFSNAAYEIFKESNLKKWKLYTSSNSIITAFYIIEKESNSNIANNAIRTIIKRLVIQDLTKKELINALNSNIQDLEDASQVECAKKIGNIDFIVTRDKKGFKKSSFNVVSPDEFVNT